MRENRSFTSMHTSALRQVALPYGELVTQFKSASLEGEVAMVRGNDGGPVPEHGDHLGRGKRVHRKRWDPVAIDEEDGHCATRIHASMSPG